MANKDRPRGFAPWGKLLRETEYVAAGAIGRGDAVAQEAGGRVAVVASAGSAHAGAFIGVSLDSAEAAGDKVRVADDPNQRFVAQADGADIDAQTDLGLNYAILGTDRDSGTRESRQEVDSSSQATTATLPLKVIDISREVDNALGANVDVVCVANNHQLKGGTGTAGV